MMDIGRLSIIFQEWIKIPYSNYKKKIIIDIDIKKFDDLHELDENEEITKEVVYNAKNMFEDIKTSIHTQLDIYLEEGILDDLKLDDVYNFQLSEICKLQIKIDDKIVYPYKKRN